MEKRKSLRLIVVVLAQLAQEQPVDVEGFLLACEAALQQH